SYLGQERDRRHATDVGVLPDPRAALSRAGFRARRRGAPYDARRALLASHSDGRPEPSSAPETSCGPRATRRVTTRSGACDLRPSPVRFGGILWSVLSSSSLRAVVHALDLDEPAWIGALFREGRAWLDDGNGLFAYAYRVNEGGSISLGQLAGVETAPCVWQALATWGAEN